LIVIAVKSPNPPKSSTNPGGSVTAVRRPFFTTICWATIGSAYDRRA
jgi:hypothetical protein